MYYHNLYQNTCKTKPLRFSHSFLFLHTSAAQVRLKNSHELWVGKPSLQEVENWQLIYQYAVLSPKSSEMKSSKNILRILEREGRKQNSIVSSSLFFLVRSKSNKNTQDSLITGDEVLSFARCWDRNEGNGCAFLPTRDVDTAWGRNTADSCSQTQRAQPDREGAAPAWPTAMMALSQAVWPRRHSRPMGLHSKAHGRWQGTYIMKKDIVLSGRWRTGIATDTQAFCTSTNIYVFKLNKY